MCAKHICAVIAFIFYFAGLVVRNYINKYDLYLGAYDAKIIAVMSVII